MNDRAALRFCCAPLLVLRWLLSLLIIALPQTAMASGLAEKFQAALDAYRVQYGFPGATAAYVLQDGTMGIAATGAADGEAGIPMAKQSRMLTASVGKTFVGATTIALAREGVLDLDVPVSRWLGDRPWFSRLPNHATITLRHLLTHSSGLPDHVHLQGFRAEVARRWSGNGNPFTPEELIGVVLNLPPLFEAGKGWAYTDTGYILIGLVIEQLTGRSYYAEVDARFLSPLGLTLTAPADSRALPGLAAGYMTEDNAFGFPRKAITDNGELAWHPGFEWTGGGLVSNSRDLALWGSALFGGRAIPGPFLDEMLKSVPISPDTPDILYGAGVVVYRTSPFGPVYGHGGWIPGYSSSLRYYTVHGVSIAFQINTDIGIADDSTPVMKEMESGLARVVLPAVAGENHPERPANSG